MQKPQKPCPNARGSTCAHASLPQEVSEGRLGYRKQHKMSSLSFASFLKKTADYYDEDDDHDDCDYHYGTSSNGSSTAATGAVAA